MRGVGLGNGGGIGAHSVSPRPRISRAARHHARVLDHRVYRAAFVPALVALFIVAFSLTDPAAPRTTFLAPDAFEGQSAYGAADPPPRDSLRELTQAFP